MGCVTDRVAYRILSEGWGTVKGVRCGIKMFLIAYGGIQWFDLFLGDTGSGGERKSQCAPLCIPCYATPQHVHVTSVEYIDGKHVISLSAGQLFPDLLSLLVPSPREIHPSRGSPLLPPCSSPPTHSHVVPATRPLLHVPPDHP